jgi:hypothetical protein
LFARVAAVTRLLAFLLLSPLAALAGSARDLTGPWEGAGAALELVEENGAIVGRLSREGGPCPVPVGTELLRGVLLDDSLNARVRLCLVAPACGDDPGTALAVLVWTRQLGGGVHSRQPCAASARSLVLRRPGQIALLTAPPPEERLSPTPPPRIPRVPPSVRSRAAPIARGLRSPRASPASAPAAEAPEAAPALRSPRAGHGDPLAVPEIPTRPIGDDQTPLYDPRLGKSPQGEPVEALLRRGAAELKKGLFERAQQDFRAALAKDGARVEAYNGVGVTFYARGDLDEALAWYKRALEVDPNFGDAYYNMGCAYAVRGDKELAIRYLRLAALHRYTERAQLLEDPDLESLRGDPQLDEIVDLMGPVRIEP